jgi:type I restriction enzyme, S subunit
MNKTDIRNARLDDLYKFQYGTGNTIEDIGGDYPIYGSNGVVGFTDKFNSENAPVIGHIGAYAGIVNWARGKHYVTYNGVICKIKDGVNPKFGYYSLLVSDLQKRLRGSTQPFVSYDLLNEVRVYLPESNTQQKIAKILSDLDAKIELNNKINAELEAMAKMLYDYWFVQFDFPNENGKPYKSSNGKMVFNEDLKREIPDCWEVKELSEIITRSGTGLNPRKNFELGNGSNFYVTIKSIENGKIVLNDKCDKIDDKALGIINNRSDLRKGDILFTSIQPVGVTYLLREKPSNWNINESVFTIRPNYNKVTSEYLYMLLSSSRMKAFTKNSSAGSIHKGIRHGVLKTFKLAYKDTSLIKYFSQIIKPMLMKIDNIDKQNQQLTELRDWLLPMLMNGQVKVK